MRAVDRPALAEALAQATPDESPGAAERTKATKEQKEALVEALTSTCWAQAALHPKASWLLARRWWLEKDLVLCA